MGRFYLDDTAKTPQIVTPTNLAGNGTYTATLDWLESD